MTDKLYIFESENSDEPSYDFFVTFSFMTSMFSMAMMLIYGLLPPVDTALLAVPLGFAVLLIGAQAIYGNLLYSYASNTTSAAMWTIPMAVLLTIGGRFLPKDSFSFYSAPMEQGGYLYGVLSHTSPAIQAIFNNRLAPIVETFALFAFTYVVLKFALETDMADGFPGGRLMLAFAASIPAGVVFGWMHGLISLIFFLKAFFLMVLSLTVVFGEEITEREILPIAVITALAASLHAAINTYEWGGYFHYLEILMTAQQPEIYISFLWLAFELLMWSVTAFGIGAFLYKVIYE